MYCVVLNAICRYVVTVMWIQFSSRTASILSIRTHMSGCAWRLPTATCRRASATAPALDYDTYSAVGSVDTRPATTTQYSFRHDRRRDAYHEVPEVGFCDFSCFVFAGHPCRRTRATASGNYQHHRPTHHNYHQNHRRHHQHHRKRQLLCRRRDFADPSQITGDDCRWHRSFATGVADRSTGWYTLIFFAFNIEISSVKIF